MKVHPFTIPKTLHQNLIVQEASAPTFYSQLHQHKELQLSLILEGKGKLIVGDSIHAFENGDFFAIPANSPHLFKNEQTEDGVRMISLFFTETTFGERFFELPDLSQLHPIFKKAREGFRLVSHKNQTKDSMLQILESDKLERFIRFLRLLELLVSAKTQALTKFLYPKEISTYEGQRMQSIFDYTIRHFQEKISLDQASRSVHMTPNAFCRFFKKRTNKTYFQFLIDLRIEHACQLLFKNEDNLSIMEISEQSGFSSISNFNRHFRKSKGIVPSSYSRQ